MSGLLVLGALHYDVVVDAPRLPRLDETLRGTAVDYRFGGKGGNQAVAAARAGASVAMAGRVGRDAAADVILAELDAAGVDRSAVLRGDQPTGMSVAITDAAGDYGAVIVSAANLENDGIVEWPTPPAIALIQNEIPEAANLVFAERLSDETRLILNAAPARKLPDALAARVDILVVNRVEALDLTGEHDPETAAEMLSKRVRGTAIVTLGADGLIVDGAHIPAPTVTPVSTHGAGDTFTGALAAALLRNDSLTDALHFATETAARFVATPIADRRSFRA